MGTTLLDAATEDPARAGAAPAGSPRVVCHLIASNFLGGPEKQILEHCLRLDPARWRAVVGSFREGRDRVAILEAARERGVPVFAIETRLPWSPGAAWQLRRSLRQHEVDLLVTHGYKPNAVGFLMRRWTRLPQIAYMRGYTAETWRVRRYESLDRFLLRHGLPRVLCVSEMTRDRLTGYGVAAAKMTAVHNAVDLPPAVRPAPLREEFHIPPDAPLLVAAGRLSAEKGHRFLVEALAHLRSAPRPHAVLLGEGREKESLRNLARFLDVADRVHMAGFRSDPLPVLRAADLVVNPSLTEGLPNVVLEAQSLEVPVVATQVGGVAEIIESGRTGWLVPAGDSAALAAAIRHALADPERARRMAATGRARIAEHFSFAVQAERLMAVYDDALGR
jgi:glycosyltransferase involved in cell wall biosynthesis